MGLPQAVADSRERKVLKRFKVTPVSPAFILGVDFAMYMVYCAVSLLTLSAAAILWGVRLHGSLIGFIGSWGLTMMSTLSVGMLVGGVAKDTKQSAVIASVLYFPMLIFFRNDASARGHAEGDAEYRRSLSADAGNNDDEEHVSRRRHLGRRSFANRRNARACGTLHRACRPLLQVGIKREYRQTMNSHRLFEAVTVSLCDVLKQVAMCPGSG